MLTAKGDDVDKIVGLELGADDYLAKPFNPRGSWPASAPCCAAAPARRPSSAASAPAALRSTSAPFTVTVEGKPIPLPTTSLSYSPPGLRPGRVLSREQLMDALKGEEYETFDRSIDVHISAAQRWSRACATRAIQDRPRRRLLPEPTRC